MSDEARKLLADLQQEIEAIDGAYWQQDPMGEHIMRAQDLVESLIELEKSEASTH